MSLHTSLKGAQPMSLAVPLLILLPVNVLGMTADGGPRAYKSVSYVGSPDGVPNCWIEPVPVLAPVANWEMNQQMKGLFFFSLWFSSQLSSYCFPYSCFLMPCLTNKIIWGLT